MRRIAVMSGKGGTGKTTAVASMAWYCDGLVLADCDVDAANLALTMTSKLRTKHDYMGAVKAHIDPVICTECGLCEDNCAFDAISDFKVLSIHCEGCGACKLVCPVDAVTLTREKSGEIYVTDTVRGPMAYAELDPGESNSGKLVTDVRRLADDIAESDGFDTLLIDGPPGTGCPAIASITGVDLVLAITEPSLSGEHDLLRLIDLVQHFSIPMCVAINKYDLHLGMTRRIEERCRENDVRVVGRIPYDTTVLQAIKAMQPLPAFKKTSPAAIELRHIWREVSKRAVPLKGSGVIMRLD